jgi:hypothetical protein
LVTHCRPAAVETGANSRTASSTYRRPPRGSPNTGKLSVFLYGRFDDQVDSTARFLDWVKMSDREDSIYPDYRMRYEELRRKQGAAGRPGQIAERMQP